MDTVNAVATWAGLILGIASIVLAIVTIDFAKATDNRSNDVTKQTITSLQKIETTVEHLSDATNNLIKAAWDKMLDPGAAANGQSETPTIDSTQVETLVAELKAELREIKESSENKLDSSAMSSIMMTLGELKKSVAQPAVSSKFVRRPEVSIDELVNSLEGMSGMALELCRAVLAEGRHLTSGQVKDLLKTPLSGAVSELRDLKILQALISHTAVGESEKVVYWFRPGSARHLETALTLVGRRSSKAAAMVERYLNAIGYIPYDPQPGDVASGASPVS